MGYMVTWQQGVSIRGSDPQHRNKVGKYGMELRSEPQQRPQQKGHGGRNMGRYRTLKRQNGGFNARTQSREGKQKHALEVGSSEPISG
jgi:hypothetical protein